MGKALLAAALALAGISQAAAFDRALSGLWYNPAQSGHGFEVTAIDADTASVAWYVYNKSGDPIWVSALLDETSPGVLSGQANYIQGIKFGEFTNGGSQLKNWGTLKLTFTACDTASVEYNGTLTLDDGTGFGAGTLPLKKLVGVTGLDCDGTVGAVAGTYGVIMRTTNPARQRGGYMLLDQTGGVTITLPGFAAYTGNYTVSGATNAVAITNLQGQTINGVRFNNNTSAGTFTAAVTMKQKDFYNGTFTGTPETGTLNGSFLASTTRTVTLASLAGTYNDPSVPSSTIGLVVNANGTFTGNKAGGCSFSGTLTPVAKANAFTTTITVTGCSAENGTYTGKVMVIDWTDYGDNRGLALALKSQNNAFAATVRRQ
jgi:hypothetical protein